MNNIHHYATDTNTKHKTFYYSNGFTLIDDNLFDSEMVAVHKFDSSIKITKFIFSNDQFIILTDSDSKLTIFGSNFDKIFDLEIEGEILDFDFDGVDIIVLTKKEVKMFSIYKTFSKKIKDLLGDISDFKFSKIEITSGKRIFLYFNEKISVLDKNLNLQKEIPNVHCSSWSEDLNLFLVGLEDYIKFLEPNGLQHGELYKVEDLTQDISEGYENYENLNIKQEQLSKKPNIIRKVFIKDDIFFIVKKNILQIFSTKNKKIYFKNEIKIPENYKNVYFSKNKIYLETENTVFSYFLLQEIGIYENYAILRDKKLLVTDISTNIKPLPLYDFYFDHIPISFVYKNDIYAGITQESLFINSKKYLIPEKFDEIFFIENKLYLRIGTIIKNLEDNKIFKDISDVIADNNLFRTISFDDFLIYCTKNAIIFPFYTLKINSPIKIFRTITNKKQIGIQINRDLIINRDSCVYILKNVDSYFITEEEILYITENKLKIFKISKNGSLNIKSENSEKTLNLELIYNQVLYEDSEILHLNEYNGSLLLFIRRGTFETLYSEYFIEKNIKKTILDSSKNLDSIFETLNKHKICLSTLVKYFSDDKIFNSFNSTKDKYAIMFYKSLLPKNFVFSLEDEVLIEKILFENFDPDLNNIELFKKILFTQLRNKCGETIIILLIFSNLHRILFDFIEDKNLYEKISTVKKYLSDEDIFKSALLTYNTKIIKIMMKILGKNLEFPKEPLELRFKVNEFIGDKKEALKYIDDINLEKRYIKTNNIYKESLEMRFKEYGCCEDESMCIFKKYHQVLKTKRPKNFYYKFYAENSAPSVALKLYMECKEYELALDVSFYTFDYYSIFDIYLLLNKDFNNCEKVKEIVQVLLKKENFNDASNILLLQGMVFKGLGYKLKSKKFNDFVKIFFYKEFNDCDIVKKTISRAKQICELTLKDREILAEDLKISFKNEFPQNLEKIENIFQNFDKYFKKYDTLQDYVDVEDMTISTVSTASFLKGLRGLKKKVMSLKASFLTLFSDIDLIKYINKVTGEKNFFVDEEKFIIEIKAKFENYLERSDKIINESENYN